MTKERRWESLFLTPEEHEELWTEIIFELRGGVFPSLASKKSADKFFWKHVKKRLDAFSPRACKFPAKVLHADLEDERALERSLARDLNVGKPLFQALESMDPVLFWDWKISNGLVLNIVRHVIEPDLEKPSSSANRSVKTLVAVGKETYAVPNVEGIDRCIAEYPALYLKWMTLMKTILEDVIPKMMLDKRITALDLAATDINVFDMHFTLEQTEDDLRKLDTFMSKCDVLLPWDEFRRNVGRKRETYHWNPSALAFKVLKQHGGTIRKVEDKENTARIVKEAPSTAIIPRVALRDLKPRPSTEALSSRRLEDYRIPQRPVVAAASSAVLNPSVRRSAVVRSVSIAGLAKHHAEPPFKRPAKTLKKNVTPKQGCVELNITDILGGDSLVKEEPKEQPKEEPKEQPKEELKEEPKEELKPCETEAAKKQEKPKIQPALEMTQEEQTKRAKADAYNEKRRLRRAEKKVQKEAKKKAQEESKASSRPQTPQQDNSSPTPDGKVKVSPIRLSLNSNRTVAVIKDVKEEKQHPFDGLFEL